MSEKIIRIKSGNEEFTMSVTEEEYLKYYRPWWQMKKKEQRNREAMERNGYTEESYEEWKENDMPEERELAMKVFGEEMSVYEYARVTGGNRRTLDFRKNKVMEKLRHFFREHGFDV